MTTSTRLPLAFWLQLGTFAFAQVCMGAGFYIAIRVDLAVLMERSLNQQSRIDVLERWKERYSSPQPPARDREKLSIDKAT